MGQEYRNTWNHSNWTVKDDKIVEKIAVHIPNATKIEPNTICCVESSNVFTPDGDGNLHPSSPIPASTPVDDRAVKDRGEIEEDVGIGDGDGFDMLVVEGWRRREVVPAVVVEKASIVVIVINATNKNEKFWVILVLPSNELRYIFLSGPFVGKVSFLMQWEIDSDKDTCTAKNNLSWNAKSAPD